jgi:TRAP transporter 4TM/12TM fusion protein
MSAPAKSRAEVVIDSIFYTVSLAVFLVIFWYYWTGVGGPTLLAMTLIPVIFALFVLQALREKNFYTTLPPIANYVIAFVYCAFSFYCAYYMNTNYMALGLERAGAWNTADLVMGGTMALLIMEYARKRHMPLFILNIALAVYAVYGYLVPGMFYHAGVSWQRVITASSVEIATGIFSNLPELALTTVGAFMLLLGLLSGFGCIDSMLRATKRVAIHSPHAIPQSAVVGSMTIGAISTSGAANSITVGTATIPAMISSGLPPATAAAIENSSSMGGQLMPPIMGIAAFLMAEFLGVDYWDVVARAWVPGAIYYISVALSVYLLAIFFHTRVVINRNVHDLDWRDWVNLGAFVFVVAALMVTMGAWYIAPMFAALYVFCATAIPLIVIHVFMLYRTRQWSLQKLIAPFRGFLDSFMDTTVDLALLLATLSIMTGVLVITGVPTKLGALLIEAAGVNLAAMVLMAFIFGAILGTGLPPAPTYILVAVVIAPPMIKAGVDPWSVHFFALFIAVFGELTPPTSITAAITAKIANASFYETMWKSMTVCVSLFTLMVAVFVHPELVVKPGWDQMGAAYLVMVATMGVTWTLQANYTDNRAADLAVRCVLAAMSLYVLTSFNDIVSTIVSFGILGVIGYWMFVRRPKLVTRRPEVVEVDIPVGAPTVGTASLGRAG